MTYLSNVGSPSVPFTVSRYYKQACCFDSLPDPLYLRGLFDRGICDVLMDEFNTAQRAVGSDTRRIARNEYFGGAQHVEPLVAGILNQRDCLVD